MAKPMRIMAKPMRIMDWGKGLRKAFYEEVFFIALSIPIAVVFLYWGIVAVSVISGDTPANTSWGDVGWFSLFLFLIVFCLRLIPAVRNFRLGASFQCPHCTQFVPHSCAWRCGACAYIVCFR
jgi:hypothetical protein